MKNKLISLVLLLCLLICLPCTALADSDTLLFDYAGLLSGDEAETVIRFLEALEDLDDVQSVYTTADLANAPESVD